jgi:leucyl aminopeptidase
MIIKSSSNSTEKTVIKFVTEDDAKKIVDFEGKAGEQTTRYEDDKTVIYVAVDPEEKDEKSFLDGVANAIRSAVSIKRECVSIELLKTEDTAKVVTASILGNYLYQQYKTEQKEMLKSVEIVGKNIDEKIIESAKTIAEAVCYSRTLQNENAAIVTPEYLAQEALKIAAKSDKMSVEILTEKEIYQKGLGLLAAVGQGSATPPRLAIISYTGAPKSTEKSAVVGKGLTFDTGGYNLKPTGSMEAMRMDMSGGAITLGAMSAIADLEPEINVIGVVPAAQSAIGKDAFLPGDVYKSYSGKTVEVLNTDAEGRLILADALSYSIEKYEPTEIIDIATLTGAVLIALGDTIGGIFSNNSDMAKKLHESGENTGEPVWELPIKKEHREAMKSDIADLQNVSKIKRNASSITAAAFLENFVEDIPWTHIDVAGTAWNSGAIRGITPKFGTGFGVRLLLDYLGVK